MIGAGVRKGPTPGAQNPGPSLPQKNRAREKRTIANNGRPVVDEGGRETRPPVSEPARGVRPAPGGAEDPTTPTPTPADPAHPHGATDGATRPPIPIADVRQDQINPAASDPVVNDPATNDPATSDPVMSDPEASDPEVSDPEMIVPHAITTHNADARTHLLGSSLPNRGIRWSNPLLPRARVMRK